MWISAIYAEKPSKYGIKIWMMCDCDTKYMMRAKVYLGKGSDEIFRGLTSDVICILVQSSSGQDRGGRNLTNDNFFTPFDFANQPKKIDTCWDNEAKKKIEKFHESSSLPDVEN
jgi:hypothetical protein